MEPEVAGRASHFLVENGGEVLAGLKTGGESDFCNGHSPLDLKHSLRRLQPALRQELDRG